MNIGIISLGCAKNLVDSELFLGLSKKYGLNITSNLNDADFIVINTCGFIASSKAESIDTIIEMLEYQQYGKKIIVMGCLVERYLDSLKDEIPEVDKFIPIKDYDHLDLVFKDLLSTTDTFNFDYTKRVISTPAKTAYVARYAQAALWIFPFFVNPASKPMYIGVEQNWNGNAYH